MSQSNPEKAMAALIPEPIVTADGVEVRPLTLGTYALLERIGSPVLIQSEVDVLALIPSLYILSHDPQEVLRTLQDLDAQAMAWADTLPPAAIGGIERAASIQVQRMLDVIAQEGEQKKKVTTAGSRPSADGPWKPTDGVSTTCCGASRRRLSSSFGASTSIPPGK